MASAEELRAEARRLLAAANAVSDPRVKQELAARALALSERAEAIVNSAEDPQIVEMNVERYRKLLATGVSDPTQRQIIEEMLSDAEAILAVQRARRP